MTTTESPATAPGVPSLPAAPPPPPVAAPAAPSSMAPGPSGPVGGVPGAAGPGVGGRPPENESSLRTVGRSLRRLLGIVVILGAGVAGFLAADQYLFADDEIGGGTDSIWPDSYLDRVDPWVHVERTVVAADGTVSTVSVGEEFIRWQSSIGEVEMGPDWALVRLDATTWRVLDPSDRALLEARDHVSVETMRVAQLVPLALQPHVTIDRDESTARGRSLTLLADLDAFRAASPVEARAWEQATGLVAVGGAQWDVAVDDVGRVLRFDDGTTVTSWAPSDTAAPASPGRAGIDDPTSTSVLGRWVRLDRYDGDGFDLGALLYDADREVAQWWRTGGDEPIIELTETTAFEKRDGRWVDATAELDAGGISELYSVVETQAALRRFDLSFPTDSPFVTITEIAPTEQGRRVRVDVDGAGWNAADPQGYRFWSRHGNGVYEFELVDAATSAEPWSVEVEVRADGLIIGLFDGIEFRMSERSDRIPLESGLTPA